MVHCVSACETNCWRAVVVIVMVVGYNLGLKPNFGSFAMTMPQ